MIKLQPLVDDLIEQSEAHGQNRRNAFGVVAARHSLVQAIDKLEALVDVYRRYLHPAGGDSLNTQPLARIQGVGEEPHYCCQPHWYTLDEAMKAHAEDLHAAEAEGELLWLDDEAEARWNEIKERL